MLPAPVRKYLLAGFAATPVVVDRLMATAGDVDFDHRPDAERFSTREMLAHLADWEPIWLGRFQRMMDEDRPLLQGIDPDEVAVQNRYAEVDPHEACQRFREGREALVAFLEALTPEGWERPACHSQWGDITIEQLAILVLGHDGYHTQQLSEWLVASARRG